MYHMTWEEWQLLQDEKRREDVEPRSGPRLCQLLPRHPADRGHLAVPDRNASGRAGGSCLPARLRMLY